MLLEGVDFEEFGRGNTPSPKRKSSIYMAEKRKREEGVEKEEREEDEEKEEEKEEKEKENDKKRIRRGGAGWRGGRHVENVRLSVITTMQFGTPLLFIQSSLTQISSRNITIIHNYYYGGRGGGRGGLGRQGNRQGWGQQAWGQGHRQGWGQGNKGQEARGQGNKGQGNKGQEARGQH